MDETFKRCLDDRKLIKIAIQPDLINKELDAAEFDFKSAEESSSGDNFKWATVQAYYSMFHTAKALVLSKGYREKSHMCLSIALKALFVDEGTIERKYYDHLKDCMHLREDADYGLIYSEASADEVVKWASEFLEAAKKHIRK